MPPVVTGTPLVSTRHSPGRSPLGAAASQSSICASACVGLKILLAKPGISACIVRRVEMHRPPSGVSAHSTTSNSSAPVASSLARMKSGFVNIANTTSAGASYGYSR